MVIQGKCAPIPEQIQNKLDSGITNCELQLMDVPVRPSQVLSVLKQFPNLCIGTVHVPFLEGEAVDVTQIVNDPEAYFIFCQTVTIAEKIGERDGRYIGIVLHCIYGVEQFKLNPKLLQETVTLLNTMCAHNRHIYFMLENVTPYSKKFGFVNFCTPKQCSEVLGLFWSKGCTRLYFNLDLCHMLMTNDMFDQIWPDEDDMEYLPPDTSLKGWLNYCGPYIRNVHCNSISGSGWTKSTHSYRLTGSDKSMLSMLCSYLGKDYAGCLTVEVNEADYKDCPNQRSSLKLLRKIVKECTNA